ncbi:uncharacterized protein LOC143432691 [Xylocopa sonorina]|uniref:uncharacterized protein LOC143432691 n=1 Tax=Xylocopa sonorina TaxID=1818115 RepID=UPI00403ABA50
MSERRDSTCQKHELPKSLQGTEDAEIVWSMIIDRFPNAAPLLCEMEAVIDRAEDLLQQLRAPCREIGRYSTNSYHQPSILFSSIYDQVVFEQNDLLETSTSFCTQDSEESTVMISARGSLNTENDIVEESDGTSKNVAEVQVSESSIYEEEVDLNGYNEQSDSKEQLVESQSNDSPLMHQSTAQEYSSEESASFNIETNTDRTTKEAQSLEEWGKIVDNAMQGPTDGNRSLKRSLGIIEKHVNRDDIKTKSCSINEHKESCIVLHPQVRCLDINDSEIGIDSVRNVRSKEVAEFKDDDQLMDRGDKSSSKIVGQRTPLSILEAYANRCDIPIEYEHSTDGPHRHKPNVYVIRGNLAGFTATSRGLTEESTKNDLAAKILQMIANQQMKDEKLGTFVDLTREEVSEILNMSVDGIRETAQKKLYQLCLEKKEPFPKYNVDKVKTYQGLTYVATCSALGYTSEGRGVRECVAKKAAADELYNTYCEDQKITLNVSFFTVTCSVTP